MAGRPAKPIELHLQDGKKHLTKEEIAARQAQEQSLKSKKKYFKPSKEVMQNPAAIQVFKKLKSLYKDITYVEGMDEYIVNRYCLLSAETEALEKLLIKMNEDVDSCEKFSDRLDLYKAISGIERNLNQNRNMLLKIEDRIFLNPTARIKNVPKKPEGKKEPSRWQNFGGGMSG